MLVGCKHGEVDQKSALVSEYIRFFGQIPKSSRKMFLKLNNFHSNLY